MQDMLVPIFGENGAIIFEYAITLAVIVVLIALVVWGVRYYGSGSVRPAVRGRLPRLAIIDTLPVDNKRKLVLLRRDNVEHLVLIGGPSDIVVEPSIVRQRVAQRPGQPTASRPSPAAVAALAATAPAESTTELADTESPPVESPPVRVAAGEAESAEGTLVFTARRTSAGAERATPERLGRTPVPSRRDTLRTAAAVEPVRLQRAHAASPGQEPAETQHALPVRPLHAARQDRLHSRFSPAAAREELDEPPNGPVPGYESAAEGRDHEAVSAFAPRAYDEEQGDGAEPAAPGGDDAPAAEAGGGAPAAGADTPEADTPEDGAQPDDMGELEQEMARLLGQISTPPRGRE